MLKLKRLTIHRYRNVKPGSQLRFHDGVNLVLGQNASGKTSLLSLISAACRASFERLKEEPFELEYVLESERFTVGVKVSHLQASFSEDAELVGVSLWDDAYEIVIESRQGEEKLRFSHEDELKGRRSLDICGSGSFLMVATLSRVREREERLIGGLLRQLHDLEVAFRLDESLDTFAVITGRRSATVGPAVPPFWSTTGHVHFSKGGGGTNSADFIPRALMSWAGEAELRVLFPGDFDLLAKLKTHLGVLDVEPLPNIVERRGGNSFTFEGFTFQVTRVDETTIHHDRLSYGQKRLLSFLYYLACNPSVVIADELVNGLHHRWIEACMNEIGARQAFLSSQNPLLFDYVTFDSVDHVQSAFVVCERELVDGRELMSWGNMPCSDAELFFRAYEAGIEHVGDILITRGLW